MKTAIGVLFYNKLNLTKECLSSIKNVGVASKSVFILDNGSDENIIESLNTSFSEMNFKRIAINKGFTGGFNVLMNWVFGEGFGDCLFLSNDTIILPDTLDALFQHIQSNKPDLTALSVYKYRGPIRENPPLDSLGGYINLKTFLPEHYRSYESGKNFNQLWDFVPGSAFWINKEVFYQLKGLDEFYHTYWEDIDFSFRARQGGFTLTRCENSSILHKIGKTCHKKSIYTLFYFQRNRILFLRKYLDPKLWNDAKEIIKNDLYRMEEMSKINKDDARSDFIKKLFIELLK